MKLRDLVPISYTHIYVSDLYISRISLPIWCSKIGKQILGIYKSLTDIYMIVDIGRQNIIILFWK